MRLGVEIQSFQNIPANLLNSERAKSTIELTILEEIDPYIPVLIHEDQFPDAIKSAVSKSFTDKSGKKPLVSWALKNVSSQVTVNESSAPASWRSW